MTRTYLDPIKCNGISLFAGPGGLDEGLYLLGGEQLLDELNIVGIDIDRDACQTARAAGHKRIQASVRDFDPRAFKGTKILSVSSPCPPFSASGKGGGKGDEYQLALDSITCFGDGCGCDYHDLEQRCTDPRTALVVETARWALLMPDVEVLICEQVPFVEALYEDVCAELSFNGWESFNVVKWCASLLGLPARRERTYLVAHKYRPSRQSMNVMTQMHPSVSMAQALGWPPGEKVRTRGARKATGGNLFSADGLSWCLTEKARTWERDSDGLRLTAREAGFLNGFDIDYPWLGSRSKQFLQVADVIVPPAGAVIGGCALDIPWEESIRRWYEERLDYMQAAA